MKIADLAWGRLRGLRLAWSWARLWRFVRLAAICVVLLIGLQFSVPPADDLYSGAGALARDSLFNYVAWEADALAGKLFELALRRGELPDRSDAQRPRA